jgi:HSP20 family protein
MTMGKSAHPKNMNEEIMTMASQSQQMVPVQLHRAPGLLVLAAPMPGLEPQDILVNIHNERVTIRGEYRGSRHNQPETVMSEWTMGPYHRDISLPQSVSGGLTNATYGNGVLVLSMPTLESGVQEDVTEFRLEADSGTRGQRVGYMGSDIEPVISMQDRPQGEGPVAGQ